MRNAELTFRELVIAVLHRVRMVLLVALIGAVLSGAYSAYTAILGISAQQELYDIQLAAYEQELSSKRASLKDTQTIMAQAREYNQNSLLMRVDPYKKQVAKLSFSISVTQDTARGVELSPGQTINITEMQAAAVRAITDRYLLLASSAGLDSILDNVYSGSTSDDYLRELIRVTEFNASAPGDVSGGNSGIIAITAIGTDTLDAKDAVNRVYAWLMERKPEVEQTSVPHTVTVLDENVQVVIDNSLAMHQSGQWNLLSENVTRTIQLQREIHDLKNDRPQAPSMAVTIAQGALLGFLLGLVLGVGIAILLYLARLPLHYATQVERQLGLRFLGGVMPPSKSRIQAFKNRLAAESLLASPAEAAALMAANVAQAAGGGRVVVLTGTLSPDNLRTLAQDIQSHLPAGLLDIIAVADVTTIAQSARELGTADGVVLAERLHASRLRQIQGVRERAQAFGKPVLGYVLT